MKYIKKPISEISSGKSFQDCLNEYRNVYGNEFIKGIYIKDPPRHTTCINLDIFLTDFSKFCKLYNFKALSIEVNYDKSNDIGDRYFIDIQIYENDTFMEFEDIAEHNAQRLIDYMKERSIEYREKYNVDAECPVYNAVYNRHVKSAKFDFLEMRIFFEIW